METHGQTHAAGIHLWECRSPVPFNLAS